MLTKARVAQPSTRIPDRYWERDQPRGHDEHWLPTAHGQGLAISDDAKRLQAKLGTLEVHLTVRWRVLRTAAVQEGHWHRFLDQLRASFDAEPLEDGMDHPAEQVITAAMESEDEDTILRWIWSACSESDIQAFAAATLLCVARQPGIGTTVWRAELVSCGLASDDIELRDAALQAAESWRDPGLRQILAAHSEPVSWLDEYRRGIIGDLDR